MAPEVPMTPHPTSLGPSATVRPALSIFTPLVTDLPAHSSTGALVHPSNGSTVDLSPPGP